MDTKNQLDSFKKVHIPHIRTHVHFLDMTKLQGIEQKGPAYTTVFNVSPHQINIAVFFQEIEETLKRRECVPIIAHELTHVLQYICDETGLDFAEEKEHGAYIMSFLFEQLIDLEPEKNPIIHNPIDNI